MNFIIKTPKEDLRRLLLEITVYINVIVTIYEHLMPVFSNKY